MNLYFIAEERIGIPFRMVTFAYQGDENALTSPVPSDAQADGMMKLPCGIVDENVQQFLAQCFVPLALASPGHRILIRLSDEGQGSGVLSGKKVTYWI